MRLNKYYLLRQNNNIDRLVTLLRNLVILVLLVSPGAWAAPKVAVSILPVHSLVSMVMQGVAEPSLLIKRGQSPHSSHLAPSSVRKLLDSDLLVWIGPNFETALSRQILELPDSHRQVSLMRAPTITRLANRKPGQWSKAVAETRLDSQKDLKSDVQFDPHLWLSTGNAIATVKLIDKTLGALDPENAALYAHNAQQAIQKIAALKTELDAAFQSKPPDSFLVYHDAFQYFERAFDLDSRGALTLNPERSPGARTLRTIRKGITDLGIKCIFHEPQFQPKILTRIAEEFEVSLGVLDPLGVGIKQGPAQWFDMMRQIKDRLLSCRS